jgi:hypothetical protein
MMLTSTRILLALNALAVAGVAALWVDTQGQLRNTQWIAPAAMQPDLGTPLKVENAVFSSDPGFYAASLERPLFSPDRRGAPVVAVDKPVAVSDTLAQASLFGLISGEAPIVLMRSEGKTLRLKLNETLGDWSLTSVGDRDATFTRAQETRVLTLEYASLSVTGQSGGVVTAPVAIPAGLGVQQAESLKRQNDELADREARVAAMRAKMAAASSKKP